MGAISDLLYGRPEHSKGAGALPRSSAGTTGIARLTGGDRAPPGGISVLGGAHFHSPVYADSRPRSAVCMRRKEEIAVVNAAFNKNTPRATSETRRRGSCLLTEAVTERGHVKAAGADWCLTPAPFANHEPAEGTLAESSATWSPNVRAPGLAKPTPRAVHGVLPGAAVEAPAPAAATPGQGFARVAEDKLEAWKLFKSRNHEDLAQMVDAARSGGTDAEPELVSTSVIEPLHANDASIGDCVLERRRDFQCPVRGAVSTSNSTDLGHRKDAADICVHPRLNSPRKEYRPRKEQASPGSAEQMKFGDTLSPRKQIREFKPVSRTPMSATSTRDTSSILSRSSVTSRGSPLIQAKWR